MHSPYHILIALSALVLLSYLFNIAATRLRIPAVLLLIGTGIGLHYISMAAGYNFFPDTRVVLELLGIIGLIFIVLEGALELEMTRDKLPVIGRSFAAALLILLATSGIICYILTYFLDMPVRQAFVYAVPLGVISSAIAIPSVDKMSKPTKEFIIYESTFSDILGIMLFNYVIQEEPLSGEAIGGFFLEIIVMLLVSAIGTGLLLLLLNYARTHVKFFLIFAFIVLIYTISKLAHLPSLLFVLIFGIMLNNAKIYIRGKLATYLHIERLKTVTAEMRLLTAETAFLVRTFFFVLFGYSIELMMLNNYIVIITGILILLTILLTRFVFLRFISKTNVIPELFIAPRGLITIILFYGIPPAFASSAFSPGILFFVILGSSLLMMIGLFLSEKKYTQEIEKAQSE